jgi:signal transduction histidine kinase
MHNHNLFKRIISGIGAKIVLPYLMLTLAVAGIGAFIVVRFTTDSLQERFHNQLLDAGRIVSQQMVDYEEARLALLRSVVHTNGVAESLAADDREGLAIRVPQIIANVDNADCVELVNLEGREIFGWQRAPGQTGFVGEERAGGDFSSLPEVRKVLEGFTDSLGEKRISITDTPLGLMIFTVGPVYQGEQRVGAAMVGSYISEMITNLSENAAARVTLYNQQGGVIATSLGRGQNDMADLLREPPGQHALILSLLRESADRYSVVVTKADEEVPLKRVQVLGQDYTLAFGDWRIRNQSLGLFSVALPNNFIVSAAATSRDQLTLLFSVATLCVFALGFLIAQRINQPLQRLVQTALAVAQGDLARRTGIQRNDEIGSLARSFDFMTDRLVEHNHQLITQASKLTAILDSIGDGVVVLDQQGVVITTNPAARQLLAEVSSDFLVDVLRELPPIPLLSSDNEVEISQALALADFHRPRRYQVGRRVLSALIAPVTTPDSEALGTVLAVRDVTREAEAEKLKDNFITGISHELRTPLTTVKGYSDLLVLTADGTLSEKQSRYLKIINRNADTLLYHINQIIDISEVQAGTLRLRRESICFTELVAGLTANWRERMTSKGLTFRVKLPEQALYVDGDPKRLQWALDNLLSNAYNYTLPTGQVDVILFREGDTVRLNVVDTGVGVAEADKPYLFTRFFRASHHATFNVPGVGLGLYIVRALIDLHGGRVWADSQLDKGSTFSLVLPVLDSEVPQKSPVPVQSVLMD